MHAHTQICPAIARVSSLSRMMMTSLPCATHGQTQTDTQRYKDTHTQTHTQTHRHTHITPHHSLHPQSKTHPLRVPAAAAAATVAATAVRSQISTFGKILRRTNGCDTHAETNGPGWCRSRKNSNVGVRTVSMKKVDARTDGDVTRDGNVNPPTQLPSTHARNRTGGRI